MQPLSGRRCLVVGSSGGLGVAIAGSLIGRGAEVYATGRSFDTQPMVNRYVRADVTIDEDRGRIVELVSEIGGVDVVVHAAGAVGFGPLAQTEASASHTLIDIDLWAPLALTTEILPHIHDGGSIVFITGAIVDAPMIGTSVYTAAKAGLSAAAGVLRRELRQRKIHVIDARPPHTETGLSSRPLFGVAPTLKPGLAPSEVAERICVALENGETEIAPSAFGSA